MFRVGRADEALIEGGLSHLVEHLALSSFDAHVKFAHNGFVEGARTTFFATGEPAEVAGFLQAVCESLGDLPLDRLDHEARVLRTEAANRNIGVVESMLWYRYGARGWGTLQLPEFALEVPDKTIVEAWTADNFTAGNAVVSFSGPIPRGLRLPLRSGPRRVAPVATPIEEVTLPAWLPGPSGGVGVTFTTARQAWFGPILSMIERRLQQRLRHDHGISYSVTSGAMPLNAEVSHSILVATGLDEHAGEIASAISDELHQMAAEGISAAEVEHLLDAFDRAQRDPEGIFSWLDAVAAGDLVGFDVQERAALREELRTMTAAASAEVIQSALTSALMRLPPGVDGSGKWLSEYPGWSTSAVEGKRYRNIADPFPWQRRHNVLIVGDEGVSVVSPAGKAVTVRYRDAAGLVVRSDNHFVLYGLDGFTLLLAERDWVAGDKALREIWERMPADLVMDLSEPSWGWKPLTPKGVRRAPQSSDRPSHSP
jgi:hypothetical protein